MNLVDSSGWLAYFSGALEAEHFHRPLNNSSSLIVPSITIHEVYRVVLRESSENNALQAVAAMQRGRLVDLTPSLALAAAELGLQYDLPMADSIILATAREHQALIWTLDPHFRKISGARYFPKIAGR